MSQAPGFNFGILNEEDLKVCQMGIPVSESEDDFSESASVGIVTPDPHRYFREKPAAFELNTGIQAQFQSEVASLKDYYESKLKSMELKNRDVVKENMDLKDIHQIKELNYRKELRAHQEVTSSQLEEIKLKQRKLASEAPIIKERIDTLKDQLGDFIITENSYLELKKTPEELRPIREWILVKVYELTNSFRTQAEKARKESDILRENLMLTTDKYERAARELTHKETTYGTNVTDMERHNQELTGQNKTLLKKINDLSQQVAENKEKADKFNLMQSNLRKAEEERARLQHQVDASTAQISQLNREKTETFTIGESRHKEVELLTSDKNYLTRENSQLVDKIHRLEDRNDRLEIEITEARAATQEYLNKLLNTKKENTSSLEEKFMSEIAEMRERHVKELESQKKSLTEIHDRRVEFLREAKEEADVKIQKIEQDLKDKTNGYDELLLESRSTQGKQEQQLIEIRSELRMKTDEHERLSIKFEDMVTGMRHTKAENEMLKDKVDILKQEFYKQENRQKSESAELKASYAVAREKLQQYEAMEQDIDHAITTQGLEINAPTTAKRRMKHSLEISAKLQQVTNEKQALEEELIALKEHASVMERELSIKEEMIGKVDAPTSALIQDLESQKRDGKALQAQSQDLLRLLREKNEEAAIFKNKSEQLEADLKLLVDKQQAFEKVKGSMKSGQPKLLPGAKATAGPKWLGQLNKDASAKRTAKRN